MEFFSGSLIPILKSASIVSVVALPTAIIPSFFFLGLNIVWLIFWCLIKCFAAGILLLISAASLSKAGSCLLT